MKNYIVYQVGSLRIKTYKRIEFLDKYYLSTNNSEYDWTFGVCVSKKQVDSIIQDAQITNNTSNLIYINNDCIYKMNISRRTTICYCTNTQELEVSFIGAPIQIIALNCNKICFHCSGVIHDKGIILFSGNSGVGKSTLMNNIIGEKFDFFCDDMCLAEQTNNSCVVSCIESFVKLYGDQLYKTDDYIKTDGEKYLVPINHVSKNYQRTPYTLSRILFLSRHDSKDFFIKEINASSLKYILCTQSVIYFNEITPLITDSMRKTAIEMTKSIDMGVLYIPNRLDNCDYESLKRLLDIR